MDENTPPKSNAQTAAGGCALGCGSLFLITGVLFPLGLVLTRHHEPEKLMVPLYIGGPSFLLGHILAIVAIQSKSEAARRGGKQALWLMWIGLAVFLAVYLVFLAPTSPVTK